MGHFRVSETFICVKINKRFVINGLPLIASLWYRALGQLGNKRLSILVLLLVVNNRCIYFFRRRYNSFRKLSRVWSWCRWNWIKFTPTFWTIRLVCFPKSFSGPKSPWRRYSFYLILSIAEILPWFSPYQRDLFSLFAGSNNVGKCSVSFIEAVGILG